MLDRGQRGPDEAGGVRNAGNPELADLLWRDARPGAITARLAYYGDYFLVQGSQGSPAAESLDVRAQELNCPVRRGSPRPRDARCALWRSSASSL
jgi:hypothetical protein